MNIQKRYGIKTGHGYLSGVGYVNGKYSMVYSPSIDNAILYEDRGVPLSMMDDFIDSQLNPKLVTIQIETIRKEIQ